MNRYLLILIVLSQFGCNEKVESLEEQFNCEINDKIYFTHKEYKAKEFQLFHPRNWKLTITRNEPYTTYEFSDTIPKLTDQELIEISDKEFNDIYYEYTSLTLAQDTIYKGFNYKEGWKGISSLIKSKDDNVIVENGVANYNGRNIEWIKYNDNTNLKDSLINLTLATCIIGERNFITIRACVFGEKETEERMCKLVDIINTITVK